MQCAASAFRHVRPLHTHAAHFLAFGLTPLFECSRLRSHSSQSQLKVPRRSPIRSDPIRSPSGALSLCEGWRTRLAVLSVSESCASCVIAQEESSQWRAHTRSISYTNSYSYCTSRIVAAACRAKAAATAERHLVGASLKGAGSAHADCRWLADAARKRSGKREKRLRLRLRLAIATGPTGSSGARLCLCLCLLCCRCLSSGTCPLRLLISARKRSLLADRTEAERGADTRDRTLGMCTLERRVIVAPCETRQDRLESALSARQK